MTGLANSTFKNIASDTITLYVSTLAYYLKLPRDFYGGRRVSWDEHLRKMYKESDRENNANSMDLDPLPIKCILHTKKNGGRPGRIHVAEF